MRDSLTPDQLENVSFTTTLRGYDRDEVDVFIKNVQVALKDAERQRSERLYAHMGEEIGNLLQHAKDSAEEMKKEAESDAARMRADAETDVARMRDEAQADAHTTRADAQADAKSMRAEAEEAATSIRSEANEDAARRTKEADDRVAELEAQEAEARNRIRTLRGQLEEISGHLQPLEERRPVEAAPNAEVSEETPEGTTEVTEMDEAELQVTAERPDTIRLEEQVEKTPT
jgi:DivIVA domain-containing protein